MILFGIRSPITAEYEETCHGLGIAIRLGVSVNGAPRAIGIEVVALDAFQPIVGETFLACAFAPDRRAELVAMGRNCGLTLAATLTDAHAVVARTARIGDGGFINAAAVVGAVSMLGTGVLVNRAASIGHHTVLGDWVSIGPGATLAGNIRVGDGSVIGAGAVILPNVRVGAGVVVAAGSVVRHHVADGALVAGNPALSYRRRSAASSLSVEDGE